MNVLKHFSKSAWQNSKMENLGYFDLVERFCVLNLTFHIFSWLPFIRPVNILFIQFIYKIATWATHKNRYFEQLIGVSTSPPSPSTFTPGLGRCLMYWTFFQMSSSTTKWLLFSLPNTNKLTPPCHPMRQRSTPPLSPPPNYFPLYFSAFTFLFVLQSAS